MKRTKIVCTIGPASESILTMRAMVREGMNMARLNFSHGTHANHAILIRHIRSVGHALGEPLGILGDLQGPKIRLGVLPEAGVAIKTGSTVSLTTSTQSYREGFLPVTYKDLHKDVKVGHRILIDDGLLEVLVREVKGSTIRAKVIHGGRVTSHKGMNFPDSRLRVSAITAKDKEDIIFGVKQGVDWMALSFVTQAKDVRALRALIKRAGKRGQILPRIMVKIEKHESVDEFDEILKETDGVMIARGDLGIEIPAEQIPVYQKEMIEKCRLEGKPVIVATQMLNSMIEQPRPTRAEVSDVANAVFDHTDAVMLSGESASGHYPVEAVRFMRKIIEEAEASPFDDIPPSRDPLEALPQATAHTLKDLALGGHIEGVVALQEVGLWTETLLLARPEVPLHLAVDSQTLAGQNNLRWGVRPFVLSAPSVQKALAWLKRRHFLRRGAHVAVVAGKNTSKRVDVVEVK